MEHGAVGAASANFAGTAEYDELLRDGNVQPSRATDAKYEETPIRDCYGRDVTEFTHNVINSAFISERDVGTVIKCVFSIFSEFFDDSIVEIGAKC